MAASLRVAQLQVAAMLSLAGSSALAAKRGERAARFAVTALSAFFAVPGAVHLFKEDSGFLSIARGSGWRFVGPVPPESRALVAMGATWGELQILVASMLAFLEFRSQGLVPAALGIMLVRTLVTVVRELLGHKTKFGPGSLAPGWVRAPLEAVITVVALLLAGLRARRASLAAQLQTDFTPGSGNALQACVASIVRRPLREVPNFVRAPEGYEAALVRWALETHGLAFRKVLVPAGWHVADSDLPPSGTRVVVRGTSPRGNFGHVVVGEVKEGGAIALRHDPHPSSSFLRGDVAWVGVFQHAP